MNEINPPRKVTALLILDGWGINPSPTDNAVAAADTPFLSMLEATYPNTRLRCSGRAVGLPEGIMGNSEVGHMNIGAGRPVFQDLVRINRAIEDRSFFQNPTLLEIMDKVKQKGSTLHLMGLLSDGGVHSHIDHLFALMDMASQMGIEKLFIHPILDGRDTPPKSGIDYLTRLTAFMEQKGIGQIATLCGRFYAMDRDTRWDRVESAYRLYMKGDGVKKTDALTAIREAYGAGETDEFVKPINLANVPVKETDGVIFFNFRADRARELAKALTGIGDGNSNDESKSKGNEERHGNENNASMKSKATHNDHTDPVFPHFKRERVLPDDHFVCMTQYEESFPFPVIFPPQHLTGILGEVISQNGLSQLRIAETEKYAHVTYFFNGGDETVFPNEQRILVPSPREVTTYDEKPEMSALAVANKACEVISSGEIDFMVLNFANMDMVGHTGNMKAATAACSAVDGCVRQVVEAIWKTGGTAMVTADHGNAEEMRDKNGNPHTAHTLNPVRFILAGEAYRNKGHVRPPDTKNNESDNGAVAPNSFQINAHGLPPTTNNENMPLAINSFQIKTMAAEGILGDIAPTVLKVLSLPQPPEMTGKPLF